MSTLLRRREMMLKPKPIMYVTDGLIERWPVNTAQDAWDATDHTMMGLCDSGHLLYSRSTNQRGTSQAPTYSGNWATGYYGIQKLSTMVDSSSGFTLEVAQYSGNSSEWLRMSPQPWTGAVTVPFGLGTANTGMNKGGILLDMVFVPTDSGYSITVYRTWTSPLAYTHTNDLKELYVMVQGINNTKVGDIAVYNKPLTAEEVAQNVAYFQSLNL